MENLATPPSDIGRVRETAMPSRCLTTVVYDESGKAFGDRSRQNLSGLVTGKEVTVAWSKRDRYGRIVGLVSINGRDICLEQIKAGMAGQYKYYQSEQTAEDRKLYADAEAGARESRLGLWTDANPIPPWDFRRSIKSQRPDHEFKNPSAIK